MRYYIIVPDFTVVTVHRGSRRITPFILNLGSRWRWLSTSRPGLFTPGIEPWYSLNKRLYKIKVKCTLVQALRLCTGRTAHRGSRGIPLLFLDHGTRRGWGVSVTPRPFFTPSQTRYPLYRRLGGPHRRSGQVRKISPPPGFDPRTVQPVDSRYTDWATRLT